MLTKPITDPDVGTWPQLEYHAEQQALWTCPKRFVYVPAGRASGKTELALRRLVTSLSIEKPWPDPIYVYAGPTYAQAKRVAFKKLLRLCPNRWITDVSQVELSISTIFGSTLFLVGLDKPERIEGIQIDGIVIDENCDIKPGTFDLNVLPTLTWRKGWSWRIGVPKRFGPGAVEFRTRFEQAQAGELPDSAGFTWPSADIVPPELLEHARATMDARDYAEQFEASWLTASGGIFHAFNREYNVRPCVYDPARPVLVGSDFNVDPHCSILAHLSGDIIEVFDELFLRNSNTPEMLDVLTSRYANHAGGWLFYGDATGKARKSAATMSDYAHITTNTRLRAMGRTLHYPLSNPPVADRFAAMNARICSGDENRRVFIDPHCRHLVDDLEIRAYKPNSREAADSGDTGHMSDALGYLIYRKWPLGFELPTFSNKITIMTGGF